MFSERMPLANVFDDINYEVSNLADQSDFVRSILRINRFAINRSDFTEGLITK